MKHQIISLNKIRRRKVFSIGIIVTADTIEWTGKWFKFVEIEEEQFKQRFEKFDDGWSYNFYWGSWEKTWKFKKLV